MRRLGATLLLVGALAVVLTAAATARPTVAPTMSLSTHTLAFGGSVTIQGAVPGAAAGRDVQILIQACGFTGPIPTGTVKTTAGGKYKYTFQPVLNAKLFAQYGDGLSAPVAVRVRPTVQLRRIGAKAFGVDVSAGNGSWFTKTVTLERLVAGSKAWRPFASGTLEANSDPGSLVAVSSATVHASVKKGTLVRAVVSQATVGSCYLPAASAAVTA